MSGKPTQKEYWSGKVGDEWAAHTSQIDAMLAAVSEAALSRAAFQPGERVLDIGCGAGATSIAIAHRVAPGGSVVGIDLSPQLIALARKRAADLPAEFLEADAGVIAFDAKFDAAFSRFGVMFFDDPVAAFVNLRAHMRDDGRLVFICWRTIAENIWSTTPIDAIRPLLSAPLPPPDPDAPGPFAFADNVKIERILARSDWRDVRIAPWDGDIPLGGGDLPTAAGFLMRIGPCARAIADLALDPARVKQLLMEHLAPFAGRGQIALPAACWIVSARA